MKREGDEGIPHLEIVPLTQVICHEEVEAARIERLAEALQRDQILRNPPIVAPLPEGKRYVVLDGANRTLTLRRLGVPDMLVQIVDYNTPGLELHTWNHLIADLSLADLQKLLSNIPGVEIRIVLLDVARANLARRRTLAYLVCLGGTILELWGGDDLITQAQHLTRIVRAYQSLTTFHRIETATIGHVSDYFNGAVALMVFPRFTPRDIMTLAAAGVLLPTGITRHVIPRRALRVNFPLSILAGPLSLAEKNAYLQEVIRCKLANKEVRYYQEPTFVFDE